MFKGVYLDGVYFSFLWHDMEHYCTTEKVVKTVEDTRILVIKKGHTTTVCLYSLS